MAPPKPFTPLHCGHSLEVPERAGLGSRPLREPRSTGREAETQGGVEGSWLVAALGEDSLLLTLGSALFLHLAATQVL